MCGISAIFTTKKKSVEQINEKLISMAEMIKHRGDLPLFNENLVRENFGLATNRLAILERDNAKQPVSDAERDIHIILNGQIFNYKELRENLIKEGCVFERRGDAEVILKLYIKYGKEFVKMLDGMFSFVIFDNKNSTFLLGRDHVGIKPLYYAFKDDVWYIASEMKAFLGLSVEVKTLEPGNLYDGNRLYKYISYDKKIEKSKDSYLIAKQKVRNLMETAVKSQVDTDLPIAIMFSGGIDSAIVLALAKKYHSNITAITFGLPDSNDIKISQRFCKENKIRQIIYTFTEQDLINEIEKAVYYGEFFEKIDSIDSIIAGFGYFIASKLGFKVALCGEGSDEIFCGYDLFKTYPSIDELSLYRLNNLHRTDLQRVDRASMRHSVEARVPFMNYKLVNYVLSLDESLKIKDGVEKYILREAFRDILPSYIVDRPKIRMPDGSGVKNTLIDYINSIDFEISDAQRNALENIGINDKASLYFAKRYLDNGYNFPNERFKQVGKDYSESGYFNFIS
ncbi:asparagine synthetase B family protein [Xenorhabdus miraniensis]|uniref:asparagine synthase (glutamine-hydrolyzing) n=1 Tax=Xenorhabdus miraniensis TaxID=351674 RepID=A0A2D0JUT1_9GAMM|nr:asparagine synthase-related protein [Xenorhabdus miraniensis]PHM50105.1 phenazine-modifying enzyme [Xenorhabdus miraniensis]